MNKKVFGLGNILVTVLFLLAIGIRLYGINLSFWHDEVYTVSKYVDSGLKGILFNQYNANNHTFYSIVIWFMFKLFGESEIAARLPSVVTGILAIAIFYTVVTKYFGKRAGIIFLILAVFFVEQIDLTTQARSYGFLYLFTAIIVYSLIELTQNKFDIKYLILISISSVLGMYSFVLFSFYVVIIYIYLFVMYKEKFRLIISFTGLAMIVTAILYIPHFRNGFMQFYTKSGTMDVVPTLNWYSFITVPIEKISNPFLYTSINSPTIIVIVSMITLLLLIVAYIRSWGVQRQISHILFFHPTILIIILAILSLHVGADRYTSFIGLNYVCLLAVGINALFNHSFKLNKLFRFVGYFLLLILIVTGIYNSLEIKKVPYENFKEATQYIEDNFTDQKKILVYSERDINFRYYSQRFFASNESVQYFNEKSKLKLLTVLADEYRKEDIILIDHVFAKPSLQKDIEKYEISQKHAFKQRGRGHIDIYYFSKR